MSVRSLIKCKMYQKKFSIGRRFGISIQILQAQKINGTSYKLLSISFLSPHQDVIKTEGQEIRGPFKPIPTSVAGLQIEMFP